SSDYVHSEMERQLAEIDRRRAAYFANHDPTPIAGRTVILVDDGIATGGTVRVALKALRRSSAARIVLAVPVAPRDTLDALHDDADEVVCLSTPVDFHAVGLHYQDFEQTTDAEVIRYLGEARDWLPRENHPSEG